MPTAACPRASRAELHTALYEPCGRAMALQAGCCVRGIMPRKSTVGILGDSRGGRLLEWDTGMGREWGSSCCWLLRICREGRVACPPSPPLRCCGGQGLIHGRAWPSRKTGQGEGTGGAWWLWTPGMRVAPPFRRGAPSRACTRSPLNEAPDSRESVHDEWRPATLSHIKSVQNIK